MRVSWKVTTVVGLLIGAIISIATVWLHFSAHLGFVAVICSLTFVLVINILLNQLSAQPSLVPKIFTEEKQALLEASTIQRSANQSIDAMWTILPYDENLKSYFNETMSKQKFTRRLIDLKNIPSSDILDHLHTYWSLLKDVHYQVFFTQGIDYEVLIVDHKEAALFHYPGQGFGCFFLRHDERKFVTVLEGMFNTLVNASTPLPIHDFKSEFDETKVEQWLQCQISTER